MLLFLLNVHLYTLFNIMYVKVVTLCLYIVDWKDLQRDIQRPTFSVLAANKKILQHVFNVLDRVGFSYVNDSVNENWSLLWAHEYPFNKEEKSHIFGKMNAFQKVNKIPGLTYLTNKILLVTSGHPTIPKAFRMPQQLSELQKYSKQYPKTMFVHKNAQHRGIEIQTVEDLLSRQEDKEESFAQVYVPNPLLIDGYKFDIGVYIIISSISPLRAYLYEGDAQFRFCTKKYHPFNPKDKGKYVVGGSFRPIWKVPSLARLYNDLGYTRREIFNYHLRKHGKDPNGIWDKIYSISRSVILKHVTNISKVAEKYKYPNSFFELVRFDFILDSDYKVYLMEINMSPNLSSSHYPQQALMYEQVIYNLLRLVNVARGGIVSDSLKIRSEEENVMQASEKDIIVGSPEICSSMQCLNQEGCNKVECYFCRKCLSSRELTFLHSSYLEHYNKHACTRLIPKPFNSIEKARIAKLNATYNVNLSPENMKLHQWFQEKCLQNEKWCE